MYRRYMIDPANMHTLVGAPGWDSHYLDAARFFAKKSKDPSTKVGCVIVGPDREIRSTGYNGFPRGIQDRKDRLTDREIKYKYICHAEENAILNAARIGVALKGCTSYCPWMSCSKCARALINVGIVEVVYTDNPVPERWQEDFDLATSMFEEAGVELRRVTDEEPKQSIDVAHCVHCEAITFQPQSEVCGCGAELYPVSKKITLGSTTSVEDLRAS